MEKHAPTGKKPGISLYSTTQIAVANINFSPPKSIIMTQKEQRKFGRPIDFENANRLYKSFISIKTRTHERIKNLLKDDPEAQRFYCGRVNHPAGTEDLAFVFDKEAVLNILAKIISNKADGIIIFNGVRSRQDSFEETTGDFTDEDGRPTIMLFPYVHSKQMTNGEPDLEVMNEDGTEHPGTGGNPGGGGGETRPTRAVGLPSVFKPGDLHLIPLTPANI